MKSCFWDKLAQHKDVSMQEVHCLCGPCNPITSSISESYQEPILSAIAEALRSCFSENQKIWLPIGFQKDFPARFLIGKFPRCSFLIGQFPSLSSGCPRV